MLAQAVFERFTERARQVIVLAQDEARTLGHGYIGSEHILLGLLREEEGLAARALGRLGINAGRVREQVVGVAGAGQEAAPARMPFTPHAKKVLELSLREALSLKHNYIGTEHILLGLARLDEGLAARILLDAGADAETVRNEIIRLLSGPGAQQAVAVGGAPADLAGVPDAQLDSLIEVLTAEEHEIASRQRMVQGGLDALRAERDRRREERPKG